MSDMAGNPHYATANLGMIDGHDFTPAGLVSEATLALAFEQRTANLIALYTAEGPLPIVEYGQLGKQIAERLGLNV